MVSTTGSYAIKYNIEVLIWKRLNRMPFQFWSLANGIVVHLHDTVPSKSYTSSTKWYYQFDFIPFQRLAVLEDSIVLKVPYFEISIDRYLAS